MRNTWANGTLTEKIGGIAITVCSFGMGAVWIWGIVLYLRGGNVVGAVAALVVPPVGFLHAVGAI